MSAQEIFNTAVTLMFGEEADRPDYQPFWLDILNYMLAENFEINNALRAVRGKEVLQEPPRITDMAEEVGYEWELERQILPMGCAGYIYMEDESGIATTYKNKYEVERSRILYARYVDAMDSSEETEE